MDEDNSTKLTVLFAAHPAEVLAYCVRRIGYAEGEDAAAEVFAVASVNTVGRSRRHTTGPEPNEHLVEKRNRRSRERLLPRCPQVGSTPSPARANSSWTCMIAPSPLSDAGDSRAHRPAPHALTLL